MKNIYTYLTFVLAFFAMSQVAMAQGKISGQVLSHQQQTLEGVTIGIEGTTAGAVTDAEGKFIIDHVPSGKTVLVSRSVGFSENRIQVMVKNGKSYHYRIVLKPAVTDLENVTINGGSLTRSGAGIEAIPGANHYISPEELAVFNYRDVNSVLAFVPGMNLVQEDGWGLRPNVGIRGTGSERSSKVTLMEDGILIAPAPYVAPAAYYFPSAGRMEAFEILKGASQIKYGPNTTGGALNLVSTAIPQSTTALVDLNAGSYGQKNAHVYAGTSGEQYGILVETFQQFADGFKTLPNNDNTGFAKQDYMIKGQLNTKADAKVFQSLQFKVGYNKETSQETYLGLTEEDFQLDPYQRYIASQKDEMTSEQKNYSLQHVIEPTDFMSVVTSVYRTDFARNWYKLSKVGGVSIGKILDDPSAYPTEYGYMTGATEVPADGLEVKANNRAYYSQGVQTRINAVFNTGKFKHMPEVGFRYHEDGMDRFQWSDKYSMTNMEMTKTTAGVQGVGSGNNRLENAYAFATYLQYSMEYGALSVIPGVRYESIYQVRNDYGADDPDRTGKDLSEKSNQVSVILPGVGVEYGIGQYWATFAGVHKGFSPPGSKEETNPEESVNYEVGLRTNRPMWSASATYYFNDYQNLLTSDNEGSGGAGSGDMFNGGRVHSKGVELEANGNLLYGRTTKYQLPVNFSYSYTVANFQNTFASEFEPWGDVEKGDFLPYVAPHQWALGAGFAAPKFAVNTVAKYQAAMRTVAGIGEIPAGEGTDNIFTMDLSVRYYPHAKVEIYGNWNNIMNQTYLVSRRPDGLRPNMPTSVVLGVKFRWK